MVLPPVHKRPPFPLFPLFHPRRNHATRRRCRGALPISPPRLGAISVADTLAAMAGPSNGTTPTNGISEELIRLKAYSRKQDASHGLRLRAHENYATAGSQEVKRGELVPQANRRTSGFAICRGDDGDFATGAPLRAFQLKRAKAPLVPLITPGQEISAPHIGQTTRKSSFSTQAPEAWAFQPCGPVPVDGFADGA